MSKEKSEATDKKDEFAYLSYVNAHIKDLNRRMDRLYQKVSEIVKVLKDAHIMSLNA